MNEMDEKKALLVYEQLIEQTMAAGFFKKLVQLDAARSSYNFLKQKLSNNGEGNKSGGEENS
jgi:hypothetical protein